MALLRRYSWPGNVRELKHAIERAVVFARAGEIRPEDLPREVQTGSTSLHPPPPAAPGGGAAQEDGKSFRERVQAFEKREIREMLKVTKGNQSEAARRLGMPLRTLTHKIRAFGLGEGGEGG